MAGRIAYYGGIVTNGLVLDLDAAKKDSYPGTGTSWRDISGNSNNGTLTNGPTYNSGNGGSIVFDGVDDYVAINNSITTTAATFIAWLRRNGAQGGYDGILFSRGANTINITGISFFSNGLNLSYTWNNEISTWNWNSGLAIPDLSWVMCAVSVSPSSATAYLYQASGITSATNNVSHTTTVMNSLAIGRDSFSSRYFNGNISIAQIYNRALSSTEITQNYNALKGRYGL